MLGAATSWRTVVFAVLALTVIRFVPVALSLLGSHLGWRSVAFIGWFGPRGLASVVFGVIASDALPGAEGDTVVATITLTVLLSVVAHGMSARPLSAWLARQEPVESDGATPGPVGRPRS